jgi:hypothetical protein
MYVDNLILTKLDRLKAIKGEKSRLDNEEKELRGRIACIMDWATYSIGEMAQDRIKHLQNNTTLTTEREDGYRY